MHFSYDPESAVGVSADGRYTISRRGDRYGIFLDIGFGSELVQTVWVRENQRAILPIDGPPSHGEEKVLEWVVDNNAATGADRLLNLADPIGDATLGELLQSFFEAFEAWRIDAMSKPERQWPRRLVRIGCRGNQRTMMEKQFD
jgi:hypothetical protein